MLPGKKPCYLSKFSLAKMEGEAAPLPPPQHREQLSGVAVVIIIAVGVQTFIMLFIFAKRQIMRFTLRGRRGPHVSVGQGGYRNVCHGTVAALMYLSDKVSTVTYVMVLSRPSCICYLLTCYLECRIQSAM